MAGNPTAVNIGIGFNVQDIAPSRGQIASFMRDVKASITDVERFAQKVKIGESLLKKGDISQAEFDRTIAMHREKYGIIDQGEKRVAEYHAHKQAMAKREEDSMLFLMRLRQEGRKMDEEAHAKKMADVAAEKKAEEDSLVFLMNLNKTRIAMEQEKHAKQMADIAAEKKAEEDSIVFLMNLNKTRIAMEQEKHAKQMADIAAEKKAEEDSMIFLMNLNKTRIAMEQEANTKRLAEIAAEKKAEENSMIFLMELRKQQRIDEEQRHAKKLAAIAAEKQAEQTLGIGAYGSASAGPRASSMAVDVVTGKIIEQKKEVSSLEQLVGTLQTSFASASTASTSNIDLVTGQLIKQKQEILTLEQAVLRYANASSKIRAEYVGIDPATGKVIQQKQEVLSLDDAINKLENDHAADVKRHAEENAAREKQLHQEEIARRKEEIARRKQAEQVHSQAIRKRQDEQRQADRDRFRSLLDQAKTHKQIVAESDRFIERMKQQYNLSDKLVKKLKEIERSRIDAGGRGVGGSGMAGGLTRNLGQFGTGVMAGFGVAGVASIASQAGQAIGDFLADSIKVAMERQRIGAAMEALLGSDQAAERMTSAMRKLDRQSMLTFSTISKGAQTLLGFGVSQEMVMPSLDALSKISMGNAERFQSLALAFGQVAASGKLAGQEILQMVNAGFNPLQEISRVTGRTMSDLKRDVEEGRVSFLQVAEAIITATEAGGRFEKISEKMLSTPAGMLAKLQSDFDMIKAEIGEQLIPAMITLLSTIADNKGLVQDVGLAFAYLFNTMADGIAIIEDFRNWTDFSQAPDPKAQAAALQRRAEAEARQKKRDAERAKEEKEKSDFNKLPEAERKERLLAQAAQMDMARITKESWKALQDQKDDLHKMLYTEEEILRMRLEINEDTRKSIEENYKKLEGTIKQKESLASGIASRNKEIEDISATIDPFEAVKKQRDLYEKNYLSSLKEIREKEKQLASLPPVAGAGFGRDMLRLEGEIAKLKEKAKLSKKQYDDINQEIATGMHGHMDDAAKEKRDRLREELKKLEEDLQKIMNDVPESLLNGAKNAYDQLREQQSAAEDAIRTAQAEAGIKSLDEMQSLAEKLKFVGEMVSDDLLSIDEGSRIADRLRNDEKKQQEQERKDLEEFGKSFDKTREGAIQIANMMSAVKEGFLDKQTANREAMEIARGLVSDADKVAMDNPRMMDLGQAKLASQKLAKQLQNEQKVIDKLTELNALATQLVQQNNNAPRLMKK